MVQVLLFTLVGAALYLATDWLLDHAERRRGARFAHRSIIFFIVILVLALASFQLLDWALA